MPESVRNIRFFGTAEPPQALRKVKLGPLSFLYGSESVRRVAWHGTELVRGIAWPIRDENWGTYAPEIHDEQIEDDDEKFVARLRFSVAAGQLDCQLNVTALPQGEIRADLTMIPLDGPFSTNRAGFTILHPIKGTSGEPLSITHSDGTIEQSEFPRLISHIQPVMDIQGLTYSVGGAQVDIAFEGEVFEMEDQRNWSDASYKTYCVPLVYPFTYSVDNTVAQSIRLTCSGGNVAGALRAPPELTTTTTQDPAPQIGLALEPGWTGDAATRELVAKVGATHLLMRIGAGAGADYLTDCASLSGQLGANVDAEIIPVDDQPLADGLHLAADKMAKCGLIPARVLALRQLYLASHQPNGPWPDGPTPADACKAAREAFPTAKIGGGMMTNFTELNRCKPDPENCDYISHGSTAIVHASDDLSVLETLESLPHIFESAGALAGGRRYRLGLISIGMRSNPYGTDVAGNSAQIRRTMAREDPRQRGLFGAAWAVGVLGATEGSAVEALCLAAPSGPFGIVYAPQLYPQAGYDDGGLAVYPLYHVVREACRMAGACRVSFNGLPDGVVAYGVRRDVACSAMLANTSDKSITVPMAHSAAIALMDADSFEPARSDADWLDNAARQSVTRLKLGPYAVAFASWRD